MGALQAVCNVIVVFFGGGYIIYYIVKVRSVLNPELFYEATVFCTKAHICLLGIAAFCLRHFLLC